MKSVILILILSLPFMGCVKGKQGIAGPEGSKGIQGDIGKDGTDGQAGEDGKDGEDGKNSLIVTSKVEIEEAICPSEKGTYIKVGLDLNSNNVLENDEVQSYTIVCDGMDGLNGKDGMNSVVQVIDPCGPNQNGGYNEVVLKLKDGLLICYFEDGGHRFLSTLKPGQYMTTDSQRCVFNVTEEGDIVE